MSAARSIALVASVSAALALVVGAQYGSRDGALTWLLLTGIGTPAVLLAHAAVASRARLGSLRRQFAVAAGLVVAILVVAALAGARLMFVSAHDALFVVVLAVLGGVVAVRVAQLFGDRVLQDVERLRATLAAVGDGHREPTATTSADDELALLAAAINDTIAGLARGEAARREVVAAVSHDLRTPITSLALLAQAIDDEVVDGPTQRQYAQRMGTHLRALSALIDDLFEHARLEAGDTAWAVAPVDLGTLAGDAADALQADAQAAGVALRAEIADGLPPVRASAERLQRVLFNLLHNAIRHTPAGGTVVVRAGAAPGGGVAVEVADTGAGIPDAERRRVFEPFFRGGDEAARTRPGAGLGLAIARGVVEAHGGRIWLEDAAVGTSVRFSVPA